MDRLAEQVVDWHNRHPLAKRITIYDVHTIGVVALPFMRSGRAGVGGPIEPVLTDEVSPESLAAWSGESTIAVNTNAAHLDALADQEAPPPGAQPGWREKLARLLPRKGRGAQSWPAFSERFVNGLSPKRIAAFAQAHGYATRPGDASWPQRAVPIDDAMLARGDDKDSEGAWPFELYLMSAAIDAGASRSRVLVGRGGNKPPIAGRRCLSPGRLGLAALVLVSLLALAVWALWPHAPAHSGDQAAQPAAPAASAASAAPTASAPAAASAAASRALPAELPLAATEPASTPASAAAVEEPAASAPAAEAASEPIPDIRPQLVKPLPTRQRASEVAPLLAKAASPAASASARTTATTSSPPPQPAAASAPEPRLETPLKPGVRSALQSGKPVVALVGPASASKAEAEALLARMRGLIVPLAGDPEAMQGQVFQSPDGWRAAVWPFSSREEAQLINATLVARGMRTKAVDF